MNATLNLAASLNGATMLTVACVCLFIALLALYCYRAQPLAVFAGLFAAHSLMSIYAGAVAAAIFIAPNWLVAFVGSELARLLCFVLVGAFWLTFPLFSPRLSSLTIRTPRLWPWLLASFGCVVVLAGVGLAESYVLSNDPLAVSKHEPLRQILAGCASGFLLISAGFLAYRWGRQRHALWAWLLCAAFALLFAVALEYFQTPENLFAKIMLAIASVLTVLALLADRVRFLQLESEVRRSLLESVTDLESKTQNLATALSHSNAGILHVDLEGRVTFANPSFAQLARVEEERLIGQPLKEILPSPLYEALAPALQAARRENAATLETSCVLNQQEKLLQVAHAPLCNEQRKVKGLHLSVIDITRYRANTRTLTENVAEKARDLQILQHCLDHTFEAIAITDAQYSIIYANEAFARSTIVSRRELLGNAVVLYRAAPPYPWPEIKKRLAQNLPWRGEVLGHAKEGQAYVSDLAVVPMLEANAQRFLWIERDLTAHRDLEQQLQQQAQEVYEKSRELTNARHYYETLLNSFDELVIVIDNKGHGIFINEYGRRRLGFSAAELANEKLPAFFKEVQRLESNYGESLQVEIRAHEAPILTRAGEPLVCMWTARPLFNAEKERLGVMAIGREVTEMKRLLATNAEAAWEGRLAERTQTLERRVQQMTKLMEISENIRLNVSLEVIMQSVAHAIQTLGWQRVAVFFAQEEEAFELAAQAGFDTKGGSVPRKFRRLTYADFAPYLVEAFRLSSSFLVKSAQLGNKRPEFMPKDLDVFRVEEWREHDCLLVPIRTRDHFVGMITVFCPNAGQYPEPLHVRDLESYADEAAIAIQNHRLLASHAARERQARWLNQIGNAFRAAGTLERVLNEIAGIMTEALQQPALVAVQRPKTLTENSNATNATEWLAASAEISRKPQAVSRGLELTAAHEKILQSLFANLTESESKDLLYARMELKSLLRLPETRDSAAHVPLKIFALRSRDQHFGLVAWGMPEEGSPWSTELSLFAQELVTQATLTLDNTRLFLQTEEKARALLRANQHISEFLASVSHELRTPLHAILQFSEILLSGPLQDKQQQHVRIVQRSGKNLLTLINDILDLSKIEAGKLEAVWEEFELVTMLRETVDTIRPLCEQKALHLQLTFDPNLPQRFVSDRAILTRVLTNLLGNAVKFTPAGEIVVAAQARNEHVHISVRDTGIGISSQRRKEIFEPFRQLDSNEARKHGGTGLGLAISQRMMYILGGDITVNSTVGKGSTFTLTLPVRAPAMLTKTVAPQGRAVQIKPANKQTPKRNAKAEALILVIDDDENARFAMQFILEEQGYQFSFAENGENALLVAQREPPDLILMDIMMPNLDGYQVARALKNQKQLKKVPIIALTARAMKGDRERAFGAGCDDYLTKPFEKKEILEMIEKWLK